MFPSLVYVLEKTPLCGEKLGGRRSKQKCSALTKLLVRRLSCCVEDGERVREMDSPFSLKNKKFFFFCEDDQKFSTSSSCTLKRKSCENEPTLN